MSRGRLLATFLIIGALLGVLAVSLPALFGQGVTQCVDGTDGGYCRSYTIRDWPDGGSVSVAALIGAITAAALALLILAWRKLVNFLEPPRSRG